MTPRSTAGLLGAALLVLLTTTGCGREGDTATAALAAASASSSVLATSGSDAPLADPSTSGTAAGDGSSGPPTSPATPSATPTPPYDEVVLAAGVRQHLACAGSGPVTVVVVTGLEVPAATWADLVAPVEPAARVCRYDRPGVGSSPPRTSPHQVVDAGLDARELATLLSVAHQPGPYLLVGQGYGTLVARAFARQHPAVVRALLLGGDAPEADSTGLSWTEAGHRVGVAASTAAAGPTPVSSSVLLVTTEPDDDAATLAADLPGMVQQLTEQ